MSGKHFSDYSNRHKQRILSKQVEEELENFSAAEMADLEMEVEIETEFDSMAGQIRLSEPEYFESSISSQDGISEISELCKNDLVTRSEIMYERILNSLGIVESEVEEIDFEGEDYSYSDSDVDDSDSEEGKGLADKLKPICLNMRREDVDILLIILREAGHEDLPKNRNSLMGTPRTTNLQTCEDGEYFHYGFKRSLQDLRDRKVILPEKMTIDIGIDGVPLSKSGKRKAWPIIARIRENPSLSPFLIGAYHGTKNPVTPKIFLRPLVDELKTFETNLIELSNKELYDLSVGNFICDTPARCLVTSTSMYNSKNGCGKCDVEGVWRKKIVFLKQDAELRTDQSFRSRSQPKHHNGKSPLEELDIDMVKRFPLDYMHLVCLGIVKLLLRLWFRSQKPLLSTTNLSRLSENLIKLGKCLPREFNRKTQSMFELGRWKATVLRTFLLYLGIIILRDELDPKYVDNFTLLSCAIRILCHPSECILNNGAAKILLKRFQEGFEKIYTESFMTFNLHNIIHLADECLIQNGPLDSFSAFEFENFMQFIKKLIHKREKPLQQLHRRLVEGHHPVKKQRHAPGGQFPYLKYPSSTIAIPDGCADPHKSLIFRNFELTIEEPNNCCILKNKTIIYITGFFMKNRKIIIIGRKFSNTKPLSNYPIEDSRDLGLYIAYNLSNAGMEFNVEDIENKACLLIYKNIFYVTSLLHQ